MKAKDLRERSEADLLEVLKGLKNDSFQNRLKNFTNRLDDTSAMKKTRREIARVTTLLAEKARGAAPVAGASGTASAPKAAKAQKAAAAPKAAKAPKAAAAKKAPAKTAKKG